MADIYVVSEELQQYRNYLLRQRREIIHNAEKVREECLKMQWKDGVYEQMRKVVNMHFQDMDKLLSGMDDAIDSLDKMLSHLDRYFACASRM